MKAGCPRPTAALIRPLTALVFEFRSTPPFPGSAAYSGSRQPLMAKVIETHVSVQPKNARQYSGITL